MITIFAAVEKRQIEKFESGAVHKKAFNNLLVKSNRISLFQIDRALNVLAGGDEDSPFWAIFGGDVLTAAGGEEMTVDPIPFEKRSSGPLETCDPAVYQNEEETALISAFLEQIDEAAFRKHFDARIIKLTRWSFFSQRKRELKENADEIFDVFWGEFSRLKSFYKNIQAGECIVIFSLYEEEDFEVSSGSDWSD